MEIQIEKQGSIIRTRTPYNAEFVEHAKRLGGDWDPGAKTWTFDARDEARVRDLLQDIFGTDGSDAEVVDVQIKASEYHDDDRIEFLGREVARRRSRDSKPVLADGVIVVEGKFKSRGGSRKNPRILDSEVDGMILEVRDVPRSAVQSEIENLEKRIARYRESEGDWRQRRADDLEGALVVVREEENDSDGDHVRDEALSVLAGAVDACRSAGMTDEEIIAAID